MVGMRKPDPPLRLSVFPTHPPRNVFLLPRDFFCFLFPLLLLLLLERDKLNRTRLVGFLLDDLLRDDAIVIL